MGRKRRRGLVACALAVGSALAQGGIARADDSWIGTSGNWSTIGNWNQGRVPNSGDNVFINNNDATNRTVTLDAGSTFLTIQLGNAGAGTTTLLQTAALNLTATFGSESVA